MKLFVSSRETLRFTLWNEPIRLTKLLPLQARQFLIATAITECFYLVLGAGERIK